MPLKTWITQPHNPFDSYYFYDDDTLAFVRIRLELGRKDSNPDPGVFAQKNRYVGFVEDTKEFDFKDFDRWSVNQDNAIVYQKDASDIMVLSKVPVAGKKPIDFTLKEDLAHPTFIHHGNMVITTGALPSNSKEQPVTVKMLKTIAKSVLGIDNTISLGSSTSSAELLADNIFKVYNEVIG